MNEIMFLGDVYLPNASYSLDCDVPYIANLEYVMGAGNTPVKNKINLCGDDTLSSLHPLPRAVCIANNHIMDYLDAGYYRTTARLNELGIAFFGAGNEENNYNNPCIIECAGQRLAFLGYCDIVHAFDGQTTENSVARPITSNIAHDIELCRRQNADRIIVNVHWGSEERPGYSQRQEELGKLFIHSGADIVIGHHSHCIQPVATVNSKFVFYSLGNTLFPNIKAHSYVDENGQGGFLYSKRHLSYGRKSLAVHYDVARGNVSIQYAMLKKNKVVFGKRVEHSRIIPKAFRHGRLSGLAGLIRMALLFAKSNLFVDGKIINLAAVKKEFEFIAARRKK